jgi:hypothetical protein
MENSDGRQRSIHKPGLLNLRHQSGASLAWAAGRPIYLGAVRIIQLRGAPGARRSEAPKRHAREW